MNISIFAKRAFLNTSPNTEFESKEKNYHGKGHLQRVSSMIRGDQIAEKIGAKFNPIHGFDKDVCIYVKPHIPKGKLDFDFKGRPFIDIIDGWSLIPILNENPQVGVIVCSKQDQETLSKVLSNKVIFIPQHHCNFENYIEKRDPGTKIKRIGVIGEAKAFPMIPEEIKDGIKKRGIEFLEYSKFFSREDIVNFYKQIDIQLVWRPYRMRLSNPLKIVNASSFGVPTIAYDESVFKEVGGCYIPVHNTEDFFKALETLENNVIYVVLSQACLEKAKEYHIDEIAKKYLKL